MADHDDKHRREMQLPAGKTCGDCFHIARCIAFGFTKSIERPSCDFHPNRFTEKPRAEVPRG